MKVNESCNDTHLVDIILSKNDIEKLLKGSLIHIECNKELTEIFISLKNKKAGK
tara:strand:- start:45 stop:206 length:162 start_codon:yes stop_codon:yes gene_type:complete